MKYHAGSWEFLKLAIIIIAIALFLFWLRYDFGANIALIAVILTAGTIFFICGAILSHYIQKSTLDQISIFNAKDATTDRYRMLTTTEIAKGETWKLKAESQKKLFDYKNDQKVIAQQNKQLSDKSPNEAKTFWSNEDTVDLEDWS
jgi:hypothetical protein